MRFATLALGLFVALATSTARADEVTYELKAPKGKGTIGAPGKTSVTIAARPGWHVNEEAPLTLKLTPEAGIAVDKPKLTRADLAENNKELARFDVAFTPSEAGTRTINGEASFVMCQATTCKPVKEKVALAVDVAPAAAAKKK
jgi:hypothetical protein